MNRSIEILAPAGSYEGMRAAMNAGCDAVYIGGSSFGARAFADNLEENTLLKAIDEAHIRDKKLYLTVNTLLKENELTGKLYSFLEKYYLQGLDAVIVQDVGVMHFIHRNFPELPIHASTQMTLTMAQGANLLKEYGVTRLVTSRELSFKEIQTMRENTELEIETFVHGALCYCYSGQCLMSSMIGGRSGNRGRCAQPCRMPYQFFSDKKKLSGDMEKFLLSPKDINTVLHIPELVEAGVNSFKIEGRMKRPEYAAAVAYIYRKYTDSYLKQGKVGFDKLLQGSEFKQDMIDLQDLYNRGGFSEGYGNNYHGKDMMSLYRPNHSGVYVGEVSAIKGRELSVRLQEKVHAQDVLEIRLEEEEGYEFTVKEPHSAGDILKTVVPAKLSIKAKTKVYRTKNNKLLGELQKKYIGEDKKTGVKGRLTARLGERLALTLSFQNFKVTAYHDRVQAAERQPMTQDKLAAPLKKTGDTLYYFEALEIIADDNIFVPNAWLNEIRRDALNKLAEAVVNHYRRNLFSNMIANDNDYDPKYGNEFREKDSMLCKPKADLVVSVSVQTKEQFEAVLQYPEVSAIYADYLTLGIDNLKELAGIASNKGISFYLSLPHICRLTVYNRLEKDLFAIIDSNEINGFIVRNFEEVALLQSLLIKQEQNKEVILNYNMYVLNKEAKSFWKEKKITSFTAPVELNYMELKLLGVEDCEMLVYGHLPLMISAQCLYESTAGCKSCQQNNTGYLLDRLGKKFFVQTNCGGCYNTIYNGQPLALHKQAKEILALKPRRIRLDFSIETKTQTEQRMKTIIRAYKYGIIDTSDGFDYTTGHYKRGVE